MKKYCFLILGLIWSVIGKGQYTVIHNFNDTLGGAPNYGSLLLSGKKLFGTATVGGILTQGCIFSIDSNGNNYKDLFDFSTFNGEYPTCTLILSERTLFGMTHLGGTNIDGCVFSVDTDGSNYKVLLNFNKLNYPQGQSPMGSLVLLGKSLFGMAANGGSNNRGCIFSLDTNGNNYKDMLDFDSTNGSFPYGRLTLVGRTLFGMTQTGGTTNNGVIFSIDTSGSGYKKVYNFTGGSYGADPLSSLIISGKVLYGMTEVGGIYYEGNIFSIDTNGANYKDLYDLSLSAGGEPYGDLTLVGTKLYGMTREGGSSNKGVIFSIDTNGVSFNDLFNFDSAEGSYPFGALTFSRSAFFGMTSQGGLDDYGVIFRWDTNHVSTSVPHLQSFESFINISPNPSTGIFNIAFEGAQNFAPSTIEVFNVLGEKVYSVSNPPSTTHYSLDLSSQPNGVYLYRVTGDDGSTMGNGKMVIQH